jgi:hypothetical protein
MVDEVDEGRSHRTFFVKIKQICDMRLEPQESANLVGEEMNEDGYVRNRARAWISWYCSLERRSVGRGTGKGYGRKSYRKTKCLACALGVLRKTFWDLGIRGLPGKTRSS